MSHCFAARLLVISFLFCGAASAQVRFTGRVWMPKTPEVAGAMPANTGLAEDYFGPNRPGDSPEIFPLPMVRCFASLEGSMSQALSHGTWEMAPAGWYYMSGSAGRYTLLFTGPSKFIRPTLFTNVYTFDGDTIDRKVIPSSYYAMFDMEAWDNKPAAAYYQLFEAKGTGVTSVGFRLVHDGIDGAGPGSQTLLVSVHRKGSGTPDQWEQIGPTVPVLEVDSGGAKNYEWSAAWNSGEVPTTPGETYALRLAVATAGNGFQMFWRAVEQPQSCYRIDKDGQAGFVARQLWMYIAGDGDGLLIPYNKHIQKQFGEFAGFSKRWSQTYVARGRGLAAVVLYAGTGGTQPGIHRQRVAMRVRRGGPDGPIVGIEKIAIGEGIFTGDASWGTFGAVFSPGEVTLEPGETYAIEAESIENYTSLHGWVNIKGMISDEKPGFNPYRQAPGELYERGTAFKNGQDVGFDLDMQIIEYAHVVENWDQAVDSVNLLVNGDMESGELGASENESGAPAAWKPFAIEPATVHRYIADEPERTNRVLRVLGGSVTQQPADGGYVQKVSGLTHLDTYRITGRVRCSYAVDFDHVCQVGIDVTGQDTDPKAETIRWTNVPSVHSLFVPFDSGPVRTKSGAISVWLRGRTQSKDGFPFRADFDDFAVRRVNTGVPGAVQAGK